VNNAGATWGAPMDDYDEKAWERVLSLNVKGVFHLTSSCGLARRERHAESPSRVINIGSIDGIHVPSMDTFAYSAPKRRSPTDPSPRQDPGPKITVNAIAPGPFPSK